MDELLQQNPDTTRRTLLAISTGAPVLALSASAAAQALAERPPAVPPPPAPHDGQNDFDFVIGDWKAHLRTLPDRLNGSTTWMEYEGTSSHRKLFGGPANLEEFKVERSDGKRTIHAQTLRLYNAETRQWSIYLLDVISGDLGLAARRRRVQQRPGDLL